MVTGKHGKDTIQEDKKVLRLLKDKEKAEYEKFIQEASTHNPTTEWGKQRRSAARKDLFLQGQRVDWEHTQQLYSKGLDDSVIAKIDAERGVTMAQDIAVGIIKRKGSYYCSVGTPHGYEKKVFHTEIAARAWVEKIRAKYKDYCYG